MGAAASLGCDVQRWRYELAWSTDYYVRLEQGRDQNPSPQVLGALARALELDEDATAHLYRLANRPTPRRRRNTRQERAPEGIVKMIQLWSETPAFGSGP